MLTTAAPSLSTRAEKSGIAGFPAAATVSTAAAGAADANVGKSSWEYTTKAEANATISTENVALRVISQLLRVKFTCVEQSEYGVEDLRHA